MAQQLDQKTVDKTIKVFEECNGNRAEAARKLGIPSNTMRWRMQKLKERGTYNPDSHKPKKLGCGVNLATFRSQYDMTTRVRDAIRKAVLLLMDDLIVKDGDFRNEFCGLSGINAWRQVSEETEFLKYQFTCDNRVWWANPKTIAQVLTTVSKARVMQ